METTQQNRATYTWRKIKNIELNLILFQITQPILLHTFAFFCIHLNVLAYFCMIYYSRDTQCVMFYRTNNGTCTCHFFFTYHFFCTCTPVSAAILALHYLRPYWQSSMWGHTGSLVCGAILLVQYVRPYWQSSMWKHTKDFLNKMDTLRGIRHTKKCWSLRTF